MADNRLQEKAKQVLDACRSKGIHVVTAESCTGGLIAATLTEIAGSSDAVDSGFVTYSNEAKEDMLGVPHALIAAHGAVSEPVARAMAEGALRRRPEADMSVSVTGIAGPGGGSAEKPVGLVYLSIALHGTLTSCERHVFPGDRNAVRTATVERALDLLLKQTKIEGDNR